MKHIFIINPIAGKKDSTQIISKKLKRYKDIIDYDIYVTKTRHDATHFIRQWCNNNPTNRVRFYACGGDGTINEVVNGIMGFGNAEMTCYPSGSGNDFIKYYSSKANFLDIKALINGKINEVDVIKINDLYSINVCNVGMEATAAKNMIEIKRKPIIGGSKISYIVGAIKAFIKARRNHTNIIVDNVEMNNETFLTCNFSNGRYVGGGFMCGPKSLNDDGLMDISIIKDIPLPKLIFMIFSYIKGTYLDKENIQPYVKYTTGKSAEIFAEHDFDVAVDGEIIRGKHFNIEIINKAIKFISPAQ